MASAVSSPHIVVYALENSRSQRIIWLLEELGLSYEVRMFKRHPKTMLAPPELKEVHPLGKSPIIVIKVEDKETTLAESGAIVEYLIETYGGGKFAPKDGEDRMRYLHWMHYAEGTFMLYSVLALVFRMLPKQGPWLLKPFLYAISAGVLSQFIKPNLDKNMAYINSALAEKEFFVGNQLTGADVMMCFPIETSLIEVEKYPNFQSYMDRLRARPAWKRAEEKGNRVDFSSFA